MYIQNNCGCERKCCIKTLVSLTEYNTPKIQNRIKHLIVQNTPPLTPTNTIKTTGPHPLPPDPRYSKDVSI